MLRTALQECRLCSRSAVTKHAASTSRLTTTNFRRSLPNASSFPLARWASTTSSTSNSPPAASTSSTTSSQPQKHKKPGPFKTQLRQDRSSRIRQRPSAPDGQAIAFSTAESYDIDALRKALWNKGLLGREDGDDAVNLMGEAIWVPRWPLSPLSSEGGAIETDAAEQGSMVAVVDKLRHLGVRFEAGLVQRLLFENGDVRGVQCSDGRDFRADKLTVLAAGSWSCAVLPELKQRLTATGQVTATIKLSPEEAELYANAPVYLSFRNFFYVFPPNKDGLVKCAEHARGYTNEQPSLADPKETVSLPRTGHFGGSLDENVPKPALDELREELRKVWPKLAEKPFASTRMCWYCDSADEDFLIGYHDAYPSLFLATGGSGHAFKFAPIMGDLCLAGIERRLPSELEKTWSFSKVRKSHPRPAETVIQGKLDISEFASEKDLLLDNGGGLCVLSEQSNKC